MLRISGIGLKFTWATVPWSKLLYQIVILSHFWGSIENCVALMSIGWGCWSLNALLKPPPPPKNSLLGLHKIKIVSFSFHTDPIWYVQKCQNQLNSAWKVSGGWGFSKVVATFNHVGGYFNLFIATIGDVSIIPSFRIGDYVLHVEHVSCVITNCGQHQWVIPSTLSIAL